MIAMLRRRNIVCLWAAALISGLGDAFLIVALTIFVYALTGSALATGAMFMVQALPRVALGSPAGVFVDRWDQRRTIVGVDAARAAVLLPLVFVQSPDQLWVVYLVASLQATIGQFFVPA